MKYIKDFQLNEDSHFEKRKRTKDLFVVKVELVVPIPVGSPDGYLEDAISEMLSENLQLNDAIVDWQYSGGKFPDQPEKYRTMDISEYEEGEAFS
jgi:hypothetical protein